MDNLEITQLTILLPLLPKRSIAVLTISNRKFDSLVKQIRLSNWYWLCRIKHAHTLQLPLINNKEDWKVIYCFLKTNTKSLLLASNPFIVQIGLENGLDPNTNKCEAMRVATRAGNIEVVKLLLTFGSQSFKIR